MNNIKTTIVALTMASACFLQTTMASASGRFYVGGLIGGGNLHYDHSDLARHAHSVSDKGFAGRLLTGFDINQNVGVELGFTVYQDPEFRYDFAKTSFSQNSLDLLAKISLPVSCSVAVYAKGGMAYVYRGDVEVHTGRTTIEQNDQETFLRPELGVGLSYAFNCRVSGDIGVYRTFGTDDLEDVDFYGGGLTVKLG